MNSRVKATAVVGSVMLLAVLTVLTVTLVSAAPRLQGVGADLHITKTADDYSPYAGDTVQFTLTVTNAGTLTATNVVVEDLLPAGVTVESVTPSSGSCTTGIPGDPLAPLSCNLGEMLSGETHTVHIDVEIGRDYPLVLTWQGWVGLLENDAWVYSETFDPDNSDNRAHVILQVFAYSVLHGGKECPESVVAGEELDYLVSVYNEGPSTVHNLSFADPLAEGVTFVNYGMLEGGGTCFYEAAEYTVLCSLDDVVPDDWSVVRLTVRVTPDYDSTSVYNGVSDWSADSDFDFSSPSFECETDVEFLADLSIEKTSEPPKILPGEQKVYHIEVTNNGPSDAEHVVVSDTLPIELRYQIDTDNCDVVDGPPDLLMCNLGTIPAGESVQFDIHALVEPDYPVTQTVEITNTAEVTDTGGVRDPNWENNSDWTTNLILPPNSADLEVTKDYDCEGIPENGEGCVAGGSVDFFLDVHNYGPLTAENVVLEDLLPEGVTVTDYQGWYNEVQWPGLSCNTGIPGDPDAPFTCGLGNMALDDHVQVVINAVIDPDYVHPILPDDYRVMENDALVYSGLHDPNNDNNQTSLIFDVYTMSDVFLWKSGPDEALAGEEISYHIRVRNLGPSTLTNFHFVDALPELEYDGEEPAVTYLGYEIEQGTGQCIYPWPMEGDHAVHCYLDDIAPGGVRVVHLRVLVNPDVEDGTDIHNEIDGWFANSGHDVFGPMEVDTEIINEADLSIRKTANPWKVFAGEQVLYTIEVTNNGPGNAYGVLVTDTLPSGVGFELSTDPDCTPVDGQVICDWAMLAVGETRSFSLFGQVEPDATPGTVSNVVTVSSDSFDPVDYNDRATAPNLIQGRADLKIRKFGKPDGLVRAGDKLTYTVIVDNLGTGYAHDVHVLDQMNSSGVFELLSIGSNMLPGHWACTESSGTFTETLALQCSLTDTLAVLSPSGGRWILTVVVQANEPQDINNAAYVDGSDYDPDLSNNEAIAEHEITAVADLELTKEAWGEMLVGCEGETELWLNEVAAGGMVTYTLTVSNTGHSTAENVVVLDEPLPLPNLLEINVQSITPSQGNCQTGHIVDEGRLSCNLGTILPDESASVTFVAHVPSWVADYTVLVNDAQAYSDMFDDNNGNDIVSNQTVVSRVADLEVGKTQEPETTLPGLEVVYTIVVTNTGPSDAHGVLISDTLPFTPTTDITMQCCASDGGQCDVPCEPPTCPAGECPWPEVDFIAQADIPAGELVIYTLTATPEWVPCDTITNTAEVGFAPWLDDIDPCPDNDVATTTSDPECNFVPLALKNYPGPDSPP